MVKRMLHIGTFLQRQHVSDVSLAGIVLMCGCSSTHLQKMLFLRSIVPTLVQKLEGRPWRIFHRIALHLLRIFPEAAPDLVAACLTGRTRFDELGLRHEYALLARDRFAHLSADDQSKILDWIEAGPDLDKLKAARQEYLDQHTTDDEAERYAKFWRRDHLAPIRDALPPRWRQRYDELVAELGEPEHSEFVSYTTWKVVAKNSGMDEDKEVRGREGGRCPASELSRGQGV